MTYALVAINEATLGGVYYCANFTTSGAQPTWARLTTTGLPSTQPDIFRVDYGDPLNRQYLGFSATVENQAAELYARNGGNWSKIMDTTIASTTTGVTINYINWLWTDPTLPGSVYTLATRYINSLSSVNYVLKSLDYGATWAASTGVNHQSVGGHLEVIGNYMWYGVFRFLLAGQSVCGSSDGGVTFGTKSTLSAGGAAQPFVRIDPLAPSRCYAWHPGAKTYLTIVGTTITQTDLVGFLTGNTAKNDQVWFDSSTSGHAVLAYGQNLYYTEDGWATSTLTLLDGSNDKHAITEFLNQAGTDLVMGNGNTGDTGSAIYHIDSKTDTSVADRSGANAGTAPYADSIPNTGYVVEYGVWAGTPPAYKGVYVYSVEEESADDAWATDLADYTNIGRPMGGDRASFRDMPADGYDKYHAQDVHAETPQIHAPWDSTSPPGAGYGIVSDGAKWIVSSAPLATTSSLHAAVTLDTDAAVILDLTGQEIGLDTQAANTVLAGPVSGAANEPTFRALVTGDLPAIALNDLSDVDTTGVVTNDIIKYNGVSWVDGRQALDDLSDVDTTGVDAYDIIRYNGATWADGRHNIRKRTAITSDTTLDDSYDFVTVDATGGNVTVTLPAPTAAIDGLEYAIKRIDASANTVTIMPLVTYLVDDSGDFLIDDSGDFLVDSNSTNVEGAIDGIDLDSLSSMQVAADLDENSWWII